MSTGFLDEILGPPVPGQIHYLEYRDETNRARVLQELGGQGFTGTATSMRPEAVVACHGTFEQYVSPTGTAGNASVSRLAVGGWAVIAIRVRSRSAERREDWAVGLGDRIDRYGFLLVGDPADLTAELALRLQPAPASASVAALVAGLSDLAERRRPIEAGDLAELAVSAADLDALRAEALRPGAAAAELVRLVAATLQYGADADWHLLVPNRQVADNRILLWCLFQIVQHRDLLPVAGTLTFALSQRARLSGAAAAVAPRVLCTHQTTDPLEGGRDRCAEIGVGWKPQDALFPDAAAVIVDRFREWVDLVHQAAAHAGRSADTRETRSMGHFGTPANGRGLPTGNASWFDDGPADAGPDDEVYEQSSPDDPLEGLGLIDATDRQAVANWCAGLLGRRPVQLAGTVVPDRTPPAVDRRPSRPAPPQSSVRIQVFPDPALVQAVDKLDRWFPEVRLKRGATAVDKVEAFARELEKADTERSSKSTVFPKNVNELRETLGDFAARATADDVIRFAVREIADLREREVDASRTAAEKVTRLEEELRRTKESAPEVNPRPPRPSAAERELGEAIEQLRRRWLKDVDAKATPLAKLQAIERYLAAGGSRGSQTGPRSSQERTAVSNRSLLGLRDAMGSSANLMSPDDLLVAASGEIRNARHRATAIKEPRGGWVPSDGNPETTTGQRRPALAAHAADDKGGWPGLALITVGACLLVILALVVTLIVKATAGTGGGTSQRGGGSTGTGGGEVIYAAADAAQVPEIFTDAVVADASARRRDSSSGTALSMRSLTLIPDLQSKAQNARGGKPGVVIVMDPMTGAVLALDQSTPDQALGQARDPGTLRRIALAAGIDVDHREAPANLCHQSVSDALAGGPACSAKDVESFFNRLSGYHNLMSSLCTLGFGGASASATLGPLRIAGSTIGDSTDSGCSPDASANKEPMPVTPLQEAVITSVFVRAAPPIPGQPPSVTAQCAHFIENQGPDDLPEIGGAKCRAGTDLKIKPEIARQVVQGMQGAANVPDHHDLGLLSDEPSGAGWATGFAVLNGRALVVTVVLPGDSAVHAADTALSVLK